MESKPACAALVLDAGPLLSLSPLRGLSQRFFTVPQVLSELKDKNSREHFERLGLSAGVKLEVREPDAASLSRVIQFAKRTGDYSVLSHADLCVLALTFALDTQAESESERERENSVKGSEQAQSAQDEHAHPGDLECSLEDEAEAGFNDNERGQEQPVATGTGEDLSKDAKPLEPINNSFSSPHSKPSSFQDSRPPSEPTKQLAQDAPIFEDPLDDDDGEGEWITPANIDVYKSRAFDLFPSIDSSDPFTTVTNKKGKGKDRRKAQSGAGGADAGPKEQIAVGCMTTDFAMQNVLLQMGLNLVGIEGKRIKKVKTWVLRCHACFKICKDGSKKFCPSCGNPTLLRTSVTAKAHAADDSTPAFEVHLKKNFVYRTRGTIFSIPAPKSGSSKKGNGEGLILREDQTEYMRAKKHEDGRREREDKKMLQRSLEAARGGESTGVKLGSWMDPDWVPEMLSVGTGGKGRRAPDGRKSLGPDGMPIIGYGRKNPNERRRKK